MIGTVISAARIWLKLILKTILALPGWVMPRDPAMVRVLFYHRVNPYPFAKLGPVSREVTVRPTSFSWQLSYLSRKGYKAIGLAEFEDVLRGKRAAAAKSVLITFDDGYEDNALFAAPRLAAVGFPAVVFVVADFLGSCTAAVWPHADPPEYGRFLGKQQLRDLESSGISIGSHTSTHPLLTRLPQKALDDELVRSRQTIEAIVGHPVATFAYPGGDLDGRVEEAVLAAGYAAAFTTATGAIAKGFRPLALRRTEVSASDSRFVFRMKLAGALDWLALKDGPLVRRMLAASNRMLLPMLRTRA